jgi:hypothetical protein
MYPIRAGVHTCGIQQPSFTKLFDKMLSILAFQRSINHGGVIINHITIFINHRTWITKSVHSIAKEDIVTLK